MKRRTLDLLFSIGGIGLAALLLVIGVVMSSNADFSNRYVTDQLAQQKITFKAADALTEEERQAPCLVEFAGQALTTGKQAECYANEFIGLHVKTSGGGKTYAEIGDVQTALRAQVTAVGLGLESWTPGGNRHFVRISAELVSGRRLLPKPNVVAVGFTSTAGELAGVAV